MRSHSQYLETRNFSSLDGLRCLSIVAVVAFHCSCFKYGYLGVNLFFVISGFLITTLLLREKNRYQDISLKFFYIRRSLRIFPLYFTIIFVYIAVVFFIENRSVYGQGFWHNLPYFLTYTSNWFVDINAGSRVIFYFAWSLATEEQFYATWPSIEKYLSEKVILLSMGVIFLISQSANFIALRYFDNQIAKMPLLINILGKIPAEILGGVLLAHCLNSSRCYDICNRTLGYKYTSVTALLALTLAIFYFPNIILVRELVVVTLMVILVASCVIREDSYLSKILTVRAVRYIGLISYGIYLMHMLCKNLSVKLLSVLGVPSSDVLIFITTMLVTTLAAGLSYRYYESYFLSLKGKYSR